DHMGRAEREEGAREPAGTGTDFHDGGALQRPGGARDPRGQIEIEQEVLAERFACRQRMLANDFAERRKIVDSAHARPAVAIRSARRSAATRLAGLARPVPAMSNAVP